MVKTAITKKLLKYRDLLKQKGLPVEGMLLFGSQVSGKTGPESDIDVCVILSQSKDNRIQEGKRLQLLALQIDSRIEPVFFSRKQYQEDKISPLLNEIRKNGVRLV